MRALAQDVANTRGRDVLKPLHVIHLRGSQADMGAQYAQILLDCGEFPETEWTLTTLGQRMLQDANSSGLAGRLMTMVTRALASGGIWRLQQYRPQPYRDRTLAFMEVLAKPEHNGSHMLLMDMFQNTVGLAGRYRLGVFSKSLCGAVIPACSSLAVWGDSSADKRLLHARNFDFPCVGVWEERPALVYCTPDEGLRYGYLGTMGADVPGTTSFNEAGLTVAAHTRFHTDVRFDGAGIVDLCHDLIRRAENLDDAIRIANERPVAANWGICVSSAQDGRAISMETAGSGVRVVEAKTGEEHLAVTNLHRHPDLIEGSLEPFPAWTVHSDGREKRLNQVAREGQAEGGLSQVNLMNLLGDTGDGETRRAGGILAQAISVTSVIMDPDGQSMALSLGETPTGWGPYVHITWDWDQDVGRTMLEEAPIISPRKELENDAVKEAYDLWRSAVRACYERHDSFEQSILLEGAVSLDPTVPSYRLMAGLLQLRRGDWNKAVEHFEVGLNQDQSPFRMGQFRLWLSRTLEVLGRKTEADEYRQELLGSCGPYVDGLRALAHAEQTRRVSARRLKSLTYSLDLVDAVA